MNRARTMLLALAAVAGLSVSVYAAKHLWSASMSADFELHDVIGSNAVGSAVIITKRDGSAWEFRVRIVGLSGVPTGVSLHGWATAQQDAPVILGLCGTPGPSALANCATGYDPSTNTLDITGDITSPLLMQWGLRGRDFQQNLSAGLGYVSAHTTLNPLGECRGQLRQIFP